MIFQGGEEYSADLSTPRWKSRLYVIIFEHDTWEGRAFDVVLLWSIVLSVIAVMLESVTSIQREWGAWLQSAERWFTALFTLEYFLRLLCARRPWRYAVSFLGIVDLLSVMPTYLSAVVGGAQSLLVLRSLRLLRVFRILKLSDYLSEASVLEEALRASRKKITVFLAAVLNTVLIVGALMYLIEGEANGFTSIPRSIYWAIVTMTTVGYGDIAPQTVLGQFVASALMIVGYGIIAVPTGIVSAEMAKANRIAADRLGCPGCGASRHADYAKFCDRCGAKLL